MSTIICLSLTKILFLPDLNISRVVSASKYAAPVPRHQPLGWLGLFFSWWWWRWQWSLPGLAKSLLLMAMMIIVMVLWLLVRLWWLQSWIKCCYRAIFLSLKTFESKLFCHSKESVKIPLLNISFPIVKEVYHGNQIIILDPFHEHQWMRMLVLLQKA